LARGALTVKDIVARIVLPGDDAQGILERIRHWTREGLLVPLRAALHPGTGTYRVYDEDTVYRAAVLNALAMEGATIRHLRMVVAALDKMNRKERRLWELSKMGATFEEGDEVYLVATLTGRRTEIVKGLSGVGEYFEAFRALIVLDLGRALALVRAR
jgi:DNA-binding transcriptional MerR regulator